MNRANVSTSTLQPQFVQVEVADVDNQHFIVYADWIVNGEFNSRPDPSPSPVLENNFKTPYIKR